MNDLSTDPDEIWRAIPGLDGMYEASNLGRIRSWAPRGARKKRRDTPIILRGGVHEAGYRKMWMQGRRRYVHRLVLETFVGPQPDGCEAAHWNGVHADNRLSNLRWASHVENMCDMGRHGRTSRGQRMWITKLTEQEVRTIRSLADDGVSVQQLMSRFGMSDGAIRSILRRRSWAWLEEMAS
jgi:hypothetical protein